LSLVKALKPIDLFSIAFGSIIGWGVFTLTADWFEMSGPWGTFIAAYLGVVLVTPIALAYSQMISFMPRAGGEYVWASRAFNKFHGFMCGWWLLVALASVAALNVTAFPVWLQALAPHIVKWGRLYTVARYDVYLGGVLLSVAAASVFFTLNYIGVKIAGRAQTVLALLLIATGSSYIALCFAGGSIGNTWSPSPWSLRNGMLRGILAWLAIVPWAFMGFNTVAQMMEEAKMSPRKAKAILIVSTAAGASFYAFITLATAAVAPWNTFLGEWIATAAAAYRVAGVFGLGVVAAGALIAIFSGINSYMASSSRLLYAMAREGLAPRALSKVHPKYGTPYRAVTAIYVVTIIAALFGRDLLLPLVNTASLGIAIAFTYTGFSLHRLRREISLVLGGDERVLTALSLTAGVIGSAFIALLLYQFAVAPILLVPVASILALGVLIYTLQCLTSNLSR